jgi:IrrE N-terminal-like domain
MTVDAAPSAFTRARIAGLCADALRRSGADGVLPTPLDAVLEAAGVRDRVELAHAPPLAGAVRDRLLGAIWFEQRALFVDGGQSEPRRRFTEAHEAVHLLCPWHAAALRLDTASELFGPLARGIEAEANFGAGQLIFQSGRFHAEALAHERSLRTAFALAGRFGASHHAAAHHYVDGHPEPVGLIVAGRWPDTGGALPIWRSIESASFRRRFGRLAACLPGGRLVAREGPGAPLAGAIDDARRSSEPVGAALWAADRGGRRRPLRAEVFNNRHCHLVFVAAGAIRSRR